MSAPATTPFCTFFLGNRRFGIEAARVQEVFRTRQLTSVPLAPAAVRGLVNLRGQILLVIDMAERLGLPGGGGGAAVMNIVVRTAEEPVSLLVDAVGDVLDLDESDFDAPPQTLTAAEKELIWGVQALASGPLHLLDVKNLMKAGSRLPGSP